MIFNYYIALDANMKLSSKVQLLSIAFILAITIYIYVVIKILDNSTSTNSVKRIYGKIVDFVNNVQKTNTFKTSSLSETTFEPNDQKLLNSYSIVNSTIKMTTSQSTPEKANVRVPKIFCLILTRPENIYTKAKQVKDIWGYKCDDYRVVAKLPAPVNHSVDLKVLDPPELAADTYKQLTRKMMSTFKFLYLHHGDFDWYLKADDDTFIFVDNLRTFLSDKNASGPVTYGYDFKVIVKGGYESGGAGYVLSRESLHRIGSLLHKNISGCPDSGFEDVDVACCLRDLNVYTNKSLDDLGRERFHPFDIKTAVTGNFPYGSDAYASNPLKSVSSWFLFLHILNTCN